jgi:hypothetical protein
MAKNFVDISSCILFIIDIGIYRIISMIVWSAKRNNRNYCQYFDGTSQFREFSKFLVFLNINVVQLKVGTVEIKGFPSSVFIIIQDGVTSLMAHIQQFIQFTSIL